MDASSVVGHFRDEVFDAEEPYLWSDPLVLRYLNEAQIAFCRETEGLEATMPLALPAGRQSVTLDRRILKIRAARNGTRVLELIPPERAAGLRTTTGTPRALIVRSRTQIEPYPTPVEDFAVTLDVFRMPLSAVESSGDALEVDEIYEPALLAFMQHRAYARPDPETFDKVKSESFLAQFKAECRKAQQEQGRRRHSAGATMFSW